MDKKSFLSKINCEDKGIVSSIYDKITLAKKINVPVFVNEFFTPNIWSNVKSLENEIDIKVHTSGIFNEAERRMLAFYNGEEINFPINLIKVINKSKFYELGHRDYLGALMALGLKREKFGDLVLSDGNCYFSICEEICSYVTYGLENVGKCPCEVIFLNKNEYNLDLLNLNYDNIIANIASNRLDALVSSICNISRTKAEEMIQQGKVMINYLIITQKDKNIEDGSIITVRGYGKYRFQGEIGWTNKGKVKIKIQKFK